VAKFEYNYQPLRIGLGAMIMGPPAEDGAAKDAPPRSRWEIGARALVERWSEYKDRHAEAPLDDWSTTVSAGLGGNLLVSTHRLGLDFAFAPSPVPDQTGRTNYVVNARLAASFSFETPVSFLGKAMDAGAYLHAQILLPRDVEKSASAQHPVVDEYPDNLVDVLTGDPIQGTEGLQTNNPGYPGYSSKGWMIGAGISSRFAL
jgi:hypothetical protein